LKPAGYFSANIGKLHFTNHANRDHTARHPDYGLDQLLLSDEPGCYDDAYIAWVKSKAPSEVESCRCAHPPAYSGPGPRLTTPPRETTEPYDFQGPEHLTHSAFVAEEAIRCIEQHRARPFFIIAGFYAPHPPLNPPRRFVDWYDPESLPLPHRQKDDNPYGLSDTEWRRVKAYYYALVSHMDDQCGRILDALDTLGLGDNTLVLFTSDHGEHLGDHGQIQKGEPGWDSCIRVPLLVRWPARIPAGQRGSELIEQIDIVPTLLEAARVEVPDFCQGRSFLPLLLGTEYARRASVFNEYRFPLGMSWKVVRNYKYKLCALKDGTELLYDLEADPHELDDVSGDPRYGEPLNDMRRELLRRWFQTESQYPKQTGPY
jgi:arylsulfatase A-like enzyme